MITKKELLIFTIKITNQGVIRQYIIYQQPLHTFDNPFILFSGKTEKVIEIFSILF